MNSIRTETPGRICLLGEHCDWAGGNSLAVPMPLMLTTDFQPIAGTNALEVTSQLPLPTAETFYAKYALPPPLQLLQTPSDSLRYVGAVARALHDRGISVPSGRMDIESRLPVARGYSSSAALCVGAVNTLHPGLTPTEVAEIAFDAERRIVGVKCGLLDQLACAWGKPLLIEWGDLSQTVTPLTCGREIHLVAGAFPSPRDTAGILATLNAHHQGDGATGDCDAVRAAIAYWGRLAPLGADALRTGHLSHLGNMMNEAQQIYEQLLSARLPALDAPGLSAACAALRKAGALGSKFSGAGGDGSVVTLAESQSHANGLKAQLETMGLSAWSVSIR